ncbi:MAG: cysteine desulfurase [Roseivirga sp.]|nr:cysteine desulfurase [Roseivirga sp.]
MIYLDSHATTPVAPEVLAFMLPYFTDHYGNGNHKMGWKNKAAIESARFNVAQLLGCRPNEIVFTASATESINIAMLGAVEANTTNRRHIISQPTEHPAVLSCLEQIKSKGYQVSFVKVDALGRIDLIHLEELLGEHTFMVSIMMVNNEIGTVQPVKGIGNLCRKNGALFFSDLTQGVGWHLIDMEHYPIDFAAFSSHKIYGPRGVGALYVKNGPQNSNISPILFGGGQEAGLRPGTHNAPGIVGFGKACEIIEAGDSDTQQLAANRDLLYRLLKNELSIKLNGCPHNRHPANLNISIAGVRGEELQGSLQNIMFSTSSACSSHSPKPSHVLSAIGLTNEEKQSSIRFGISKFNTKEEIYEAARLIIGQVKRLSKPVQQMASTR